MIAVSLFSAVLFSLLLVSLEHYLPNKFKSKRVKGFMRDGARNEFITLLRSGEYITIFLLLGMCFIYTFTNIDLLIVYSPIFWLNNILEPKILASGASIATVLIVYFVYLLVYRYSLYKDTK
ncbi:MAG: hypothetical protein IJ437_01610 [Clostridia bacterium]|nr:hypothetical protein [Clostridia bacterium]